MTVAIVGQDQFVCHTLARTVLGKENDVPVAGPMEPPSERIPLTVMTERRTLKNHDV